MKIYSLFLPVKLIYENLSLIFTFLPNTRSSFPSLQCHMQLVEILFGLLIFYSLSSNSLGFPLFLAIIGEKGKGYTVHKIGERKSTFNYEAMFSSPKKNHIDSNGAKTNKISPKSGYFSLSFLLFLLDFTDRSVSVVINLYGYSRLVCFFFVQQPEPGHVIYPCSQTYFATFTISLSSSSTCRKGSFSWEKQVLLSKVVWFWFIKNKSPPTYC